MRYAAHIDSFALLITMNIANYTTVCLKLILPFTTLCCYNSSEVFPPVPEVLPLTASLYLEYLFGTNCLKL